MAEGHPDARGYDLPFLVFQSRIARKRVNRRLADEAVMVSLAAGSLMSKKTGREFQKQIKALREDD